MTGGLYRFIRHPQYLGLAVVGMGTVLLWPRFLVLISFVVMLILYALLARWEEERCLRQFGESYRSYQSRTGRFLPASVSKGFPSLLPAAGPARATAGVLISIALIAATVLVGFVTRDYTLSKVASLYTDGAAVLSPAPLGEQEMKSAYQTSLGNAEVQEAISRSVPGKLIVYVVPVEWYLPDLPIESNRPAGGHVTPANFDRSHYKVLFTRARSHSADATGIDIVKSAYGRDPIILVRVNLSTLTVLSVETPPPHVVWGDISTPMY